MSIKRSIVLRFAFTAALSVLVAGTLLYMTATLAPETARNARLAGRCAQAVLCAAGRVEAADTAMTLDPSLCGPDSFQRRFHITWHDGVLTVTSYGSDGMLGGTGDAADLSMFFTADACADGHQ